MGESNAATDLSSPYPTLEAVMVVVRQVVECNRTWIDNGRTYLRET
ncbi:hypothetical protein [Arthrobacter sp. 2MCAF14]